MSGFPVKLNGQTFSNSTLGGQQYYTNYPELLQAVVDHGTYANFLSDRVDLGNYYPELGLLDVMFSTNKKFYPGMSVVVTDDFTNGKVYAVVVSYKAKKGSARLRVEGYTANCLYGPTLTFTAATKALAENSSASFYDIPYGGTSAKTANTFFAYQAVPNTPNLPTSVVFDDFCSHFSSAIPHPYQIESGIGGGAVFSYPRDVDTAPAVIAPRAGVLGLGVKSLSDNIVVTRGRSGRPLYGGVDLNNFESLTFAVKIPVLGSAGVNDFLFSCGYIGSSASLTDIRNFGGITVSYTAQYNSGKFLIITAKDGSSSTQDTLVTAVANTWYTIKFTLNGLGEVKVYINGNFIAMFAASTIASTGQAGFYYPALHLKKTAGNAERLVLVDYLHLTRSVIR